MKKSKGIWVWDVDGTLWCGIPNPKYHIPKGKITPDMVVLLKNELPDWYFVVLSKRVYHPKVRDRLIDLNQKHDVFDFLTTAYRVDDPPSLAPYWISRRKTEALRELGKGYDIKVYVGDRKSDEDAAKYSGFTFLFADMVAETISKVGVEPILRFIGVKTNERIYFFSNCARAKEKQKS